MVAPAIAALAIERCTLLPPAVDLKKRNGKRGFL